MVVFVTVAMLFSSKNLFYLVLLGECRVLAVIKVQLEGEVVVAVVTWPEGSLVYLSGMDFRHIGRKHVSLSGDHAPLSA